MPETELFRTRRRGLLWLVAIALVMAGVIALWLQPQPIEDRLIALQAKERFGSQAAVLQESLPIQALMLDYHGDRLLRLKAEAALAVYPEQARLFLELFGEEPEFRKALRRYGEYLILPMIYFYRNPVGSVEMVNRVAGTGKALSPEERAWYAVNFANQEGHDFIGQFEAGPNGEIQWIWTERITEGLSQFFTGGIRTLESRYRTDQPVRASDLGWAALDAVIIGSAVKFLKVGRAAAGASRAAAVSARSAAYSSRLARAGRMASLMVSNAKWPAMAALAYVAVRHPALLNDLFAGVANVLGLPHWVVQVPAWFLVLLPVLVLARWLLRWSLWLVLALWPSLNRRSTRQLV